MSGSSMQHPCDPQSVAEFLRALAHPVRLAILCRLLDGELPVGGFEAELGLKQPGLSQHLGHLREAGLVVTRRESRLVFYRLADERVRPVLAALRAAFAPGAMPGREAPPPAPVAMSPRTAAPPPRGTPPAPRPAPPGGECGVFSTAGWPAA